MSPNPRQPTPEEALNFHRALCDMVLEGDAADLEQVIRNLEKSPEEIQNAAHEVWVTALSENLEQANHIPEVKAEPAAVQKGFSSMIRQRAQAAKYAGWAKRFPIREMRRLRFSLPEEMPDAEALLEFFGVANPKTLESVCSSWAVAYRQTRVQKVHFEATAAWIRETELVARDLQVADFDEKKLYSALPYLRSLTRLNAESIMDPIQNTCAVAGVAVVLVPGLPGTSISGCARWINHRRAIIGLTLRYKTDDQLWFTLFHEIGHILLHRSKRSFVIDNAADDLGDKVVDPEMEAVETEANLFARDVLIPPASMAAFLQRGVFTNEAIHDFAEKLQIGPGIVVGRLQHDGILLPYQGNKLKQKLEFGLTEE